MNGKTHETNTLRRLATSVVLGAAITAVAVPAAAARPGIVPSTLGSPDPRESAQNQLFSPGTVASRLGSQDPKESATQILYAPGLVATHLGSQDPRGTAEEALASSSVAASDLGTPDVRDAFQSTQPSGTSSNDFEWGKVGIEIAAAVCGLLLLVALGIGARQLHHGGQRLRRA